MSIISRDDLAGTIAVGMEGATDSYDQLEELSGWVAALDTENLQLSQAGDGSIIISPTEPAPPERCLVCGWTGTHSASCPLAEPTEPAVDGEDPA